MTEGQIRKQWLILLIINMLMSFFYLWNQRPLSTPGFDQIPASIKYVHVFLTLFWVPLFCYIIYRCGYRKPGTKLITFILIMTPIGFVSTLMGFLLGKVPVVDAWWFWPLTLFQQGLGVWWFFLNWKMRSINKRRQKSA